MPIVEGNTVSFKFNYVSQGTGYKGDFIESSSPTITLNTNLSSPSTGMEMTSIIGMSLSLGGGVLLLIAMIILLVKKSKKSKEVIDYEGEVNFLYFLYQSKRNDNCIVNLKMYDFLLTNTMFKSYHGVWDDNDLQYYSFVNLNVYTNKLSSQERLLADLPGIVNIYKLS